jgi:hypothetical protein
MTHEPEVKILTRGPDRGNSTPRRQVRGVEHHPRLRFDRGRPARGRAEEVVGALVNHLPSNNPGHWSRDRMTSRWARGIRGWPLASQRGSGHAGRAMWRVEGNPWWSRSSRALGSPLRDGPSHGRKTPRSRISLLLWDPVRGVDASRSHQEHGPLLLGRLSFDSVGDSP